MADYINREFGIVAEDPEDPGNREAPAALAASMGVTLSSMQFSRMLQSLSIDSVISSSLGQKQTDEGYIKLLDSMASDFAPETANIFSVGFNIYPPQEGFIARDRKKSVIDGNSKWFI